MSTMVSLEKTDECQKQIKKLTSKNKELEHALREKIRQILENPYHFKPLGKVMAGMRRVHVLKCFVLTYDIDEAKNAVILKRFTCHDEVY